MKVFKKQAIIALLFFFLFKSTYNSFAFEDDPEKRDWYIGFGIGTGDGFFENGSKTKFSDYFENAESVSPKISLSFGIGAVINPNFHIGGEVEAIMQSGRIELSGEKNDIELSSSNFLAVFYLFPMEEGFYIKGGAGFGTINYNTFESGDKEEIKEQGYAFKAGVGYFFRLGSLFHLGLSFDYTYHKYEGSLTQSQFWTGQLSFYWF